MADFRQPAPKAQKRYSQRHAELLIHGIACICWLKWMAQRVGFVCYHYGHRHHLLVSMHHRSCGAPSRSSRVGVTQRVSEGWRAVWDEFRNWTTSRETVA